MESSDLCNNIIFVLFSACLLVNCMGLRVWYGCGLD